jgi:hypothetical protein
MIRILLAAAFLSLPAGAMADESIAGQWHTTADHGVIIAMDILADGYWTSQTVQNGNVVAEMAGSYEQQATDADSGSLVFTPVKSKTDPSHGPAEVEHDQYRLTDHGKTLRLRIVKSPTSMVFYKQPFAAE